MHFKLSWHPREVAEQWPMGSVVLCRLTQNKSLEHGYTYILSLCFMPESMSFDKGYEYLLIEQASERKQDK